MLETKRERAEKNARKKEEKFERADKPQITLHLPISRNGRQKYIS